MKTVKQLRERMIEIAGIKNEHDRQTAALLWWESLTSGEQECVREEIIIPTVTAVWDMWQTVVAPVVNEWGEFMASLVQQWRETFMSNPEVAAYLEKLSIMKGSKIIQGGRGDIRFCDGCKWLHPTEEEQNQPSSAGGNPKHPHWCGKYDTQVRHMGHHPHLVALHNCESWELKRRASVVSAPPN
jgi:hypothetical protein